MGDAQASSEEACLNFDMQVNRRSPTLLVLLYSYHCTTCIETPALKENRFRLVESYDCIIRSALLESSGVNQVGLNV